MITLGTEREEVAVRSTLTGSLVEGEPLDARLVFFIGDDDYTEALSDCGWGQSEIPLTLSETKIASRLPRRLERAEVRLCVSVADVLIPQLWGVYTTWRIAEDRSSTEITSSTGGALLSRVTLRGFVEFEGVPPEFVVRDGLMRVGSVGGYEKGLVDVEPMGSPILYFSGEEGFKVGEKVQDVLSRVQEQLPQLSIRDTGFGGVKAEVSLALGREEEVLYAFDARDIPGWIPPELAEEQYSEVEVFRENPDGTDAYRQRAEIVYRGVERKPFSDTPYLIPLNDDSAEGSRNAQKLANERAEAMGRGLYESSGSETRLPVFWPLMQKADVFRVDETARDVDGLWDRAWHLKIASFKQRRSVGFLSSAVDGYEAVLVEEDLIAAPSLIVPGISPGVLDSRLRLPYGVLGDDIYFDEGLPWVFVSTDGDDLVFTTDAPAYIEGDDIVLTDEGL